MNTYTVWLRLQAETSDELLERIGGWDLTDDEGVISVTHQPDLVTVPPEMQPPPVGSPIVPPVRRVDSVDPNEGPTTGGTPITLAGVGFTNIGGVRFESDGLTTWADAFVVVDDKTITCNTPATPAGVVDVVAFDGDPGDAVLIDGFTFV
jgi:IPT/TIG domain-containing protein